MTRDLIKQYHHFMPELKLSGIAVKSARIANDPEYTCKRRQEARNALFHDANRHSVHLEPDQQETPELTDRLMSAWKFATENYEEGNITDEYLLELVAHLDETHMRQSCINTRRHDYRTGDVRMSGHGDVHPPGGQRVAGEMYDLVEYLNMTDLNPGIRALNAHMHICRIHPFYDGNGRSSRMLMNAILFSNGLPTVCIPKSERETYNGLLRGAMRDYGRRMAREQSFDGEQTLMYYQIDKMGQSVDSLDDTLKKHREYVVETDNFEKPQLISAKRQIQSHIRRHDSGSVRMKQGTFTIYGDISQKHIRSIFDDISGKCGRYEIKSQ